MKLKNIYAILLIFTVFLAMGMVSAEEAVTIESGTVSGGVDLVVEQPWESSVIPGDNNATKASLEYEIPYYTDVKSVLVIVNTYSGTAADTYGVNSTIYLKIGNSSVVIDQQSLNTQSTNDGQIYNLNNYTTKVYSDYQILLDITDKVDALPNGEKITIEVLNKKLGNLAFDGRIKMIALVFIYDDGDNDNITYWLNVGQDWSNNVSSTIFNTSSVNKKNNSKYYLENVGLTSTAPTYYLNNMSNVLLDPIITESKSYFQYNKWDVTSDIIDGDDTSLIYRAGSTAYGASYKNALSLLTYNEIEPLNVSGKIAGEYTSVNVVYAGVNNTYTVTITNNENRSISNVLVELYDGNRLISNKTISIAPLSNVVVSFVDTEIRPLTENTEVGNNNSKVSYTIIVKNELGEVNYNGTTDFTLVYNGNLGKNDQYPQTNYTINRTYVITGDVIVINQDDSKYMSAAVLTRTETWNLTLNGQIIKEGLLYVSYNWDSNVGGIPIFNATFNGQLITPIAHYRDQGNLGTYGTRGYGLFVFNVTSLLRENNTFYVEKNGLTAFYPSSLLVLTDDLTNNDTIKTVFIAEDADLLSYTNNKYIPAGAYSNLNVDGINKILNVTFYAFAASAQVNEGNIIFNNEIFNNVWNDGSNSISVISKDVTNAFGNSNTVFFQATGSTILALHQILVVESAKLIKTNLEAENITLYYKNGTGYIVYLTDNNGNPLNNKTVVITINGVGYNHLTNGSGAIKLDINLNPGVYEVTVRFNGDDDYDSSFIRNTVTVLTTVIGNDLTKMYRNGSQFFITIVDGQGAPIVGKNVSMNINGVFYNCLTNGSGVAKLDINLRPGTYIITAEHPVNGNKLSKTITVLSTLEGNDITKYFRNGTQYEIKVLDGTGAIVVGKNVSFNINGVFYNVLTNNYGIATLEINLNPGTYIITAQHPLDGLQFSNDIVVLPALKGKDVNMTASDRKPYEVSLVNDQGLPFNGQTVLVNINGVIYDIVTDINGTAKLPINLNPGSYIATAMFNGYSTSNTVVVKN